MANDNVNFLLQVKKYLEPMKNKVNYESLYHGFIDYSRFITYSKMFEPFCKLEDAKILDVGCGSGGMSVALKLLGANPIGFDIEIASVRMAKLRLGGGNFVLAGGYTFPVFENSFDGVTLLHVIEHVDDPQKIVNEAYRTLKKRWSTTYGMS